MSSKIVTLVKWVAMVAILGLSAFVIMMAILTSGNFAQIAYILTYLLIETVMGIPWLLVMLTIFMVPA